MTTLKLGKVFKRYRVKAGLTQAQAAQALGYFTRQHISNLERGESISTALAVKIARVYRIPQHTLIEFLVDDFVHHIKQCWRRDME